MNSRLAIGIVLGWISAAVVAFLLVQLSEGTLQECFGEIKRAR